MTTDSVLKNEILQWLNCNIDENKFNDFRISSEQESSFESLSFENKKRIHFLIHKNLYNKILSYPRIITSWRIVLLDKFSSQSPNVVLKIFKEVVSYSYLKGDMIRWFNCHIEEEELNEFKRLDRQGRAPKLHGFEIGEERRIDVLVNKYLYGKYLNYSSIMKSFSKKVFIKFRVNYSIDNITKVFNEIVYYSFLKSDIIQFVDRYITEKSLNRFKIPDRQGRLPELNGFEEGRERRINILAHRHLYDKVLDYSRMLIILKRQVFNKFETNHEHNYIEKVFAEVISEIPERIHRYRIKRISNASMRTARAYRRKRKIDNNLIKVIVFIFFSSFFLSLFCLKRRRR